MYFFTNEVVHQSTWFICSGYAVSQILWPTAGPYDFYLSIAYLLTAKLEPFPSPSSPAPRLQRLVRWHLLRANCVSKQAYARTICLREVVRSCLIGSRTAQRTHTCQVNSTPNPPRCTSGWSASADLLSSPAASHVRLKSTLMAAPHAWVSFNISLLAAPSPPTLLPLPPVEFLLLTVR